MSEFSTNITVKTLEDILAFAKASNQYTVSLHLESGPIVTSINVSKTDDWDNPNMYVDVTDIDSV